MNKYTVLKEIGIKCKKWREETGLTQEAIGKLAGVTRQAICAFESGKSDSEIILYYYIVMGCKL